MRSQEKFSFTDPDVPTHMTAKTAQLRLSSAALFGDARVLIILHAGREYRLRLTQNDKLILTA